ncbi:MAG: T9SS type A sorting domain-containing protein [Bacteroidota bacterium]
MRLVLLTIVFFAIFAIIAVRVSAQWQQVPIAQIGHPSIYGLASNDTYVFVGVTDSNLLRSSDNGATWEKPSPGIPSLSPDYILFNHKEKLFVGMRPGSRGHISVYTSIDNGTHWDSIPQGSIQSFMFVRHISADENDSIYICGQDGVGILRDSGWVSLPQPHGHNLFNLISKNNILYLSDLNFYRSTDRGVSWTALGTSAGQLTGIVYAGDNYLIAGIESSIRRSSDGGNNWVPTVDTAINLGRTEIIVPAGPVLFAGTWHGVWRSTDNGVSWSSVNVGLRAADTLFKVLSMTVHNDMVFIGTEGQGLWKRPLSELLPPADVAVTGVSTASIHLSQSYPNPATQDITIEYALPHEESMTLKLYDAYLNEISTIAQGRQDAGSHRVSVNVRSLASGVYFYRLSTGTMTLTQRMLVTR